MKPLSYITETFTESVIREMTRICDAAGGINLSQGFPDFEAPLVLKQAAIKAITDDLNQYPVTFGEPELRKAISNKVKRFNGIGCDPDTDITVTCGATEAMMATLKAIINPGDEFIVFEPFYENYGPDGILSGATPKYVRLRAPQWQFDPDELARAFSEKTKAIVINTPNNPTGKVFSKSELEQIAAQCLKWDVYAVTDEIYEHIIYDGNHHISIATLPGMAERTVTINSVSKSYSLTGWRVGWAIASAPITSRIRKVHDFLTVGAPTPLQHASVTALELTDDYYRELATRYETARARLFGILTKAGFVPIMPAGAYYMMTDVSALMPRLKAKSDTEFSRKLIETTGVASVPGSSFFNDKSVKYSVVRFAFCKKASTLDAVEECLKAIE
jgi:aspartate/methionine/tyrosine aminotransferase